MSIIYLSVYEMLVNETREIRKPKHFCCGKEEQFMGDMYFESGLKVGKTVKLEGDYPNGSKTWKQESIVSQKTVQ